MKKTKIDIDRELGREVEECVEPGCSIKEQLDTMLAYGPMNLGLNEVDKKGDTEIRVEKELRSKI